MKSLFRLAVIIGALPNTLTNGTTADATQVMADLNWIVNQVNANAAPLATTALTNANNNFTVVQSGQAATQAANFPIASQVQNSSFLTLSSTLGTNTLTARCASLPLGAYSVGQMFTFVPSQTNTDSATINIDSLGSSVIKFRGAQLLGSELVAGQSALIRLNAIGAMPVFDFIGPRPSANQTQQEAAVSSSAVVTPSVQHFHPSSAKVWAAITYSGGGTPTVQASYNVASLTDTGVGDVTVNLTTPFSSILYAAVASVSMGANSVARTQNRATGSFEIVVIIPNTLANADNDSSVICCGDQ